MTKDEKLEFLKLVKQGVIEALKSAEAQLIIKKVTLEALKSKEGEEILSDYFDKAFKEVVVPPLEKMFDDVEIIKEDVGDLKMDVNYLKESAAKRDKFVYDMREKMLRRTA